MTVVDEFQNAARPTSGPPPSGGFHRLRPFVDVARDLQPVRGPSRLLSAMAVLGVLSALFHVGVWVIDDTAWSGPVSWRKPIVFALSIGLLGWTIGWLLDRLPKRRLAWPIAVTYVASGVLEVGLITVQAWRGEASHFNTIDGGTNALVFALMGISVVFISLSIVAVTIWSFIERPDDTAVRHAAWWGFALVIVGLGLGQWLITLGNDYVDRFNEVPSTVTSGEAGVAKFPHAIALHGVQLFIVAAAMISRAGLARQGARRFMTVIGASYAGILIFTTLQTLAGRAPSQFSLAASLSLAVCLAVLCLSLGLLARRLLSASGTRVAGRSPVGQAAVRSATRD